MTTNLAGAIQQVMAGNQQNKTSYAGQRLKYEIMQKYIALYAVYDNIGHENK